ncbi:ricin-type beta-trefoil lectin domain protein [Streptomyces sp. PR69]|uniref:ricin-type beta-trefoil lectin domain protein n=1 Tax=Streptomyces sp. PR69 TaxID=2984950 RepID=UPI0022641A8F|nr:ricin-type beta-trefoil lectin domain protein [Streptomyces sp. PR69]
MQHPRTPHTSPAVPVAAAAEGGDAALAALLGGEDETFAVAALLTRHWQAVSDYAALCAPAPEPVPAPAPAPGASADGGALGAGPAESAAGTLAAAAFRQTLGELREQGGLKGALRPRLLVTVREIAAIWAADPRVAAMLPPGLRNPDVPGESRRLVSRAFQMMPAPVQILLWHTEVEAEGISIPAALLGVDPRSASGQREQAREMFRKGCLRAHIELAPNAECRHYSRLLDISLRRGGTLIPDIRQHLAQCPYCRYAAQQLRQSDGRLALLLAEGVLGHAARGYLDGRPGRLRRRAQQRTAETAEAAEADPAVPAASPRAAGRHSRASRASRASRVSPARIAARGLRVRGALRRLGPARLLSSAGAGKGAGAGAGAVASGVLFVVLCAVVAGLLIGGGQDGDGGGGGNAGPAGPSGQVTGSATPAPGGQQPSRAPSAPAPSPPSSGTSAAAHPGGPLETRLRNAGTGLCLDVHGRTARSGVEAAMSRCTSTATQRWLYEDDGLLRSFAAPGLCLRSRELDGVARLGGCAGASADDADDVRYDLTIHGLVIPRWNEALALVPASDDAGTNVVIKIRDGSVEQRWFTDFPVYTPRLKPDAGADSPTAEEVSTAEDAAAGRRGAPTRSPHPQPHPSSVPSDAQTPPSAVPPVSPSSTASLQAGEGERAAGRSAPEEPGHGLRRVSDAERPPSGPRHAPPLDRPAEGGLSPQDRSGGSPTVVAGSITENTAPWGSLTVA